MNLASRQLFWTATVLAFVSCRAAQDQTSETLDATTAAATASVDPADSFEQTEKKLFDSRVNELHILIHGDTWNKMTTHRNNGGYACEDSAPYGHIKELKYINKKTGETVVINNAGMRVKGNTSCDDPIDQKGFKIKLNPTDKFIEDANGQEIWRLQNTYEEWGKRLNYSDSMYKSIKKQNLFGLSSFSLRRGGNDPSRMHDALSSDVFEYGGEIARKNNIVGAPERGGPVYRGGLIWVRIHNGFGTILEGHFGVVELVDEDLIASHYSKKSISHLFKIKEGKGTFLDSDMPSDRKRLLSYYEPEVIDGDGYTSDDEFNVKQKLCKDGKYDQSKCDKLNKERDRAEQLLREFKKQLNAAVKPQDVNARRKNLSAFLDIDNILSYMVSANLTGHWDSMVGPISNNDYLFHNKKSDKWGIIAWDLDNTFGTNGQNYPWMASISDFGVNLKYRPLFQAVMDNFKSEYRKQFQEFMNGVYDFDRMGGKITALRDAVAPNSKDDMYENLFKFKNHRWGNAWCNLKNGDNSKVVVKNGWPDIYKKNGKYVANCN